MARYNGLIIPRSYNDYFSRSDPQAILDIVALGADGELNAESKNPLQNQAIAKIVPVTASPDNKLIVQSQISGLTADVETIKNIIPNTASETNELADKNFVNSTVGTNTANYIYKTESGGEKVPFSSVAELEAYAGTVTNNDYAFVTGIDENGNVYYDRYKADVYDGVVTWAKEYRLNNSSFTAEQWAAIQSGITAEKVAQFEGAVSPVDVVQSGNMSAVTSNAVNGALTNYINKTDAATLQQALQLPGVLSGAVAAGDNKAVKSSAVNNALTDFFINKGLDRLREKRVGEIYNSKGYWKVSLTGYYSRPIVIKCIGTLGFYDIAMFGEVCSAKLIRLGNNTALIRYKYTNPPASGSDGCLFIKSNEANITHTIFIVDMYSGSLVGSLEESTEEEYNNANGF